MDQDISLSHDPLKKTILVTGFWLESVFQDYGMWKGWMCSDTPGHKECRDVKLKDFNTEGIKFRISECRVTIEKVYRVAGGDGEGKRTMCNIRWI